MLDLEYHRDRKHRKGSQIMPALCRASMSSMLTVAKNRL